MHGILLIKRASKRASELPSIKRINVQRFVGRFNNRRARRGATFARPFLIYARFHPPPLPSTNWILERAGASMKRSGLLCTCTCFDLHPAPRVRVTSGQRFVMRQGMKTSNVWRRNLSAGRAKKPARYISRPRFCGRAYRDRSLQFWLVKRLAGDFARNNRRVPARRRTLREPRSGEPACHPLKSDLPARGNRSPRATRRDAPQRSPFSLSLFFFFFFFFFPRLSSILPPPRGEGPRLARRGTTVVRSYAFIIGSAARFSGSGGRHIRNIN